MSPVTKLERKLAASVPLESGGEKLAGDLKLQEKSCLLVLRRRIG